MKSCDFMRPTTSDATVDFSRSLFSVNDNDGLVHPYANPAKITTQASKDNFSSYLESPAVRRLSSK
jgi:hypothetical protein